jgi:DNA mismatch repair protein MutS
VWEKRQKDLNFSIQRTFRLMSRKETMTPLMRQYFEVKDKHPDTILLFRVGDFYETFGDDAILVSRELGITLTKRNNGGDQTPLAGFPFHSIDSYLPRLIRRGFKVAVCEQTQDPEEAKAQKKIVEREVTEIVTPGVALSDRLLDHNRNNYILALHQAGSIAGIAFADISTGEFSLTQLETGREQAFVLALQPSEVLVSRKLRNQLPSWLSGKTVTFVDDWIFEGDFAYNTLLSHFKTHSLKGFGVEELPVAQVSAGALLHYVSETQKSALPHLRRLQAWDDSGFMSLDNATKRNLELLSTMAEGSAEGSLFGILDHTRTPMGARLLRQWVMRPLRRFEPIHDRLQAVENLFLNHDLREALREELSQIADLERLMARIAVGRCSPRDIVQVRISLAQVPAVKGLGQRFSAPLLSKTVEGLHILLELQERIGRALDDAPPATIRDGGFIRAGYNSDLDQLRSLASGGKSVLATIQSDLIRTTGISSLKVGFNKVFGYYIEVTNIHKDKIPDFFIRKQTLVNAERYITPELKELEEKILTAEERSAALEAALFEELRQFVAGYAAQVQETARNLAAIDVLQSLAYVAHKNRYVRPDVDNSTVLDIKAGRHPVVETMLPPGEPFIPNDIQLENETRQILIITGPNMAGKSIILRQTGLIVLLAQIGSFVPADSAHIGMVDKIFTRVGASDNLAAGESTFLVEMNEAANILNNATPRSLILLDEVGRGTSTFDGLSIAWSLAEYLHNQPSVAAKTLFATHYHELNELAERYGRIVNVNVLVREHDGKVIFMRKLVPGGADHSYGIQVASMAGLPEPVILRAKEILLNLEGHSLDIDSPGIAGEEAARKKRAAREAVAAIQKQQQLPQLDLFQLGHDPALEVIKNRLEAADVNRMTPLEAMLFIAELKRMLPV